MTDIEKIVKSYFKYFPDDRDDLTVLSKQMADKDTDIFNRKNFTGHICANALVLNSKNEVLLVFHNKLNNFLQPGGHVDEDDNSILDATLRELREETGIVDIALDDWHNKNGIPIMVESHMIPENSKKKEKEHMHHGFMYVFNTDESDVSLQLSEVSDFKWTPYQDIIESEENSFVVKSLKRMVKLGII